jgi:hypothetical protein
MQKKRVSSGGQKLIGKRTPVVDSRQQVRCGTGVGDEGRSLLAEVDAAKEPVGGASTAIFLH